MKLTECAWLVHIDDRGRIAFREPFKSRSRAYVELIQPRPRFGDIILSIGIHEGKIFGLRNWNNPPPTDSPEGSDV